MIDSITGEKGLKVNPVDVQNVERDKKVFSNTNKAQTESYFCLSRASFNLCPHIPFFCILLFHVVCHIM